MASGGSEDTSDEIFNFKCSPCLANNRTREAEKYCVECQGYCCQSCADIIHMMPALKGHKLLDKTNYKSSSLQTELPAVPTDRCSSHQTKVLDMYCGNHDEVGCTTCMVLNHRSCADVQSIPDIVDSKTQKTDIDKIHQKVQDMKSIMEKVINARNNQLEDLKKTKSEAVVAVKDLRKEMENVLEQLEIETILEVEKTFQEAESKLLQEKKMAEEELNRLKQTVNDLKKSEGNKAQQFVAVKISSKNVAITEDFSCSLQTCKNVKISFVPEPSIREFLQRLKIFGSVRHDTGTSTALRSPKATLYSARSINDLNIKDGNDINTCYVLGSCLTEDGSLVLADSSNSKIKRANIANLSVTDHCPLPAAPYGISCTSRNEAAVCLSNETIQFVSLGKQMTLTRQLTMNHNCFGIAYKEDNLYITDNRSSLYIHDMRGKLLKTVTQDNQGQNLFSHSRNVAFSDVDDKVFVAGWNKGLVVIDGQGNHQHTFTDAELRLTSGVCTDRSGTVFVCGYSSNNVIQIGKDWKKMSQVVKSSDGLKKLQSLCFDYRQCKLVITQDNSNVVKIISLQ